MRKHLGEDGAKVGARPARVSRMPRLACVPADAAAVLRHVGVDGARVVRGLPCYAPAKEPDSLPPHPAGRALANRCGRAPAPSLCNRQVAEVDRREDGSDIQDVLQGITVGGGW